MYKARKKRRYRENDFRMFLFAAFMIMCVGIVSALIAIKAFAVQDTDVSRQKMISNADFFAAKKANMAACHIETGVLSNDKTMYLTFDDGPSRENTDAVLDILKEKNIKATFFVIGEYVEKYPETARRIVSEGHTVGIHCYIHDYNTLYASKESYIADFEKAYETVKNIMGVEPKLFRFPGGSINAYNKDVCRDIIEEMEKRGFIYYDWNAGVEDATGKDSSPSQLIKNARESTLGRKKIVLLAHDRVKNTVLCLDGLIDEFSDYVMKPLTEDITPVQFVRFWEEN